MKLESLRDLFVEELQDLYSAEHLLLKALPKMAHEAASPDLRNAINEHLAQTRRHIQRLDRIFDQLPHVDRNARKCKGIEGIVKESENLMDKDGDSHVLDAAMTAGVQKAEHYEIAAYGAVANYASLLGRNDWAQLLQQTLVEEKQTDAKLTQIGRRANLELRAA
ncbi:MAG TPA: ferritin-like domain-containing protein [Candidatus Angelobacter sp.]|nr:ferritin-like domain-containing protein [Candidatus Angelobacter sp.]